MKYFQLEAKYRILLKRYLRCNGYKPEEVNELSTNLLSGLAELVFTKGIIVGG